MQKLDESGVTWVGYDSRGGHCAVLLAEKGDALYFVNAFAGEARSEDEMRAAMISVMKN